MMPYILITTASLLWVVATQFYAKIGRAIPIYRFNFYKTCIAFTLFLTGALLSGKVWVKPEVLPYLIFSGLVGYALADLFIFYGFAKIGPARTLMITSFEPSLIALFTYIFFAQSITLGKMSGIFMVILCLYFLALEKKKSKEVFHKDDLKLLLWIFLGMNLEALGTTFSKQAFNLDPELTSTTANVYRLLPAFILLPLVNRYYKCSLSIKDLSFNLKRNIIFSSTIGTWLALLIYLKAIALPDHPAVIAALGSLSPFYASIYEHFKEKSLPNRYFFAALLCMLMGIFLIVFSH